MIYIIRKDRRENTMQKCLIKVLIVISFLFLFNQTIYAETYKQYRLDDYVFFDPVSTNKCNYTNYWTYYNQDTTCYRFIILDSNDTTSKSTIKIMLDHDVGYDTYDNYQSVLTNKTSNWTRYTGTIDIIDCDYDNNIYEEKIKGYEECPERGARCTICFNLRLEKTAKIAKENNYDYFCKLYDSRSSPNISAAFNRISLSSSGANSNLLLNSSTVSLCS